MEKINRKAMYDALARHTQAFPDFGDEAARIDDIMLRKVAADTKMDLIDAAAEAAEPAPIANDVSRENAVNDYLLNLNNNKPEQFEVERFLSFEELAINAGV